MHIEWQLNNHPTPTDINHLIVSNILVFSYFSSQILCSLKNINTNELTNLNRSQKQYVFFLVRSTEPLIFFNGNIFGVRCYTRMSTNFVNKAVVLSDSITYSALGYRLGHKTYDAKFDLVVNRFLDLLQICSSILAKSVVYGFLYYLKTK